MFTAKHENTEYKLVNDDEWSEYSNNIDSNK